MMSSMQNIAADQLIHLAKMALKRVGVSEEDADLTAKMLVTADLMGITPHGTRRLGPYIERIRRGLINPQPQVNISRKGPAIALVDGDNGLGPVVAGKGLEAAVELAKDSGIAYVGCRNSNHFGPAAPYVLKGCFQDVLTIVGTNAFPSMAPWGGKDVLVGNNPLGIGIPRRCAPHFILDISMSVVSRGKIRARAEKGERIPLGWALDSKGKATDDPRKALEGYVLPIGGHKGYGLALAIDVIAGVLTGSGFGSGIRSLYQQMEEPQHIGHFFICINPTFLMEREEYHMRVERLFQEIKSSTPIDEQLPVLLPGELEGRYYQERSRLGIPYEEDAYAVLQDLARGKYNYRIPKM